MAQWSGEICGFLCAKSFVLSRWSNFNFSRPSIKGWKYVRTKRTKRAKSPRKTQSEFGSVKCERART
jgi:hypothetical protein